MFKKTNLKQHLLSKVKICAFFDSDCKVDDIAQKIKEGADIIILKESGAQPRNFLEKAKLARQLCSFYDKLFMVQGRVDIAYLAQADGVYLLKSDISPSCARKIINDENLIIGVDSARKEDFSNVDFIIFDENIFKNTYSNYSI